MPFEFKIAALALLVIRFLIVAIEVRRIARRLGESGMMGRYFVYDLLSPLWALALSVMLARKTTAYGDSRLYRRRGPAAGGTGARRRRYGLRIPFQPLPRRYPPVVRAAAGRVNDADDLLQETFIKVYINLHRYSTDYTFGQWVYTIARNTFIDFRAPPSGRPVDRRAFLVAPPRRPRPPRRASSASSSGPRSSITLERLTPRYRTLIVMRFFDEYSYEEIAAKLTLPLGTVKTQIHRAREQMCKLIAQGDER